MSAPEGHFLYQSQLPIRWGDMDALGHVNNTQYFRYFEQARLEWYENAGFGTSISHSQGMVIVNAFAEFLRPVVYPGTVTVDMHGHSPGTSSFISTYLLSMDGVVYTRASAKIVWIDHVVGKAIPLPESVRAMLASDRHSESCE